MSVDSDFVDFRGQSGTMYRYWFLSDPATAAAIKDEGGNYSFVKRLPNGNYRPMYFGKADTLRGRIPHHECWVEALQLGVTHVMAHTTPAGDAARCAEERDLIGYWNPPMNTQHRTVG